MHLRQTALALLTITLLTACQKEKASNPESTTSTPEPETCTASTTNGRIIEGRYIIELKTTAALSKATEKGVAEFGQNLLRQQGIGSTVIKASFNGEVSGFVADLSENEVTTLRKNAAVQTIEPDRIVALATCFTVVAPSLVTWNVTKTGYGNGIGKTAWVVDTGIDMDHPDLTVDATRSRSFLSGNTSPDDENGHGTHVAGVIGGLNNTSGVLGVASGATLVSVRVLDADGKGTGSGIIQALSYISANAKAGDVVNMSLGEDTISTILDNQVKAVAAKGIYIAIAAGNDGKAANLYSPARANAANIYTVSAVDSLNRFASFSNWGNDVVDYAAPGVRIVSTFKEGKYARMSGTSMATPHVAGLLLLVGRNIKSSGNAVNDPDGTPDAIAAKE